MRYPRQKKLISVLISAALCLSLCACGEGTGSGPASSYTASSDASSSLTEPGAVSEPVSEPGPRALRESLAAAPECWSPLGWRWDTDLYVLDYTAMGLYDVGLNSDKTASALVCELASTEPVDVTASYDGGAAFNVPDGSTEGYVFSIALNPNATWENGEAITAADYIYSMEKLLSPETDSPRAADWFSGSVCIAGAESYHSGEGSWEGVGLLSAGDYELTVVLKAPVSVALLEYALCVPFLVYRPLYEKGGYGLSAESYVSCGPYRLASFDGDTLSFVKNESWYGYSDGNHQGQFQTEEISCQIIPDHAQALALFESGGLDTVSLMAGDMEKYSNSDSLLLLPETFTGMLSINSDSAALSERESDGVCKTILSYPDFRRALSLAVDREGFAESCTAAHEPAYGLISPAYMLDGAAYRDTEKAAAVITGVFGDEDGAVGAEATKYTARGLFLNAWFAAQEAGDIMDGDVVELEVLAPSDDPVYLSMTSYIQGCINEILEGTELLGRVTLSVSVDASCHDRARAGDFDIVWSALGGAASDPWALLEFFCDSSRRYEFGFDPDTEQCEIELGEDNYESMSYSQWLEAIRAGEYGDARLSVFAGLERGLLEYAGCVPVYSRVSAVLYSERLAWGANEPCGEAGFGGVRYLSYTSQ